MLIRDGTLSRFCVENVPSLVENFINVSFLAFCDVIGFMQFGFLARWRLLRRFDELLLPSIMV